MILCSHQAYSHNERPKMSESRDEYLRDFRVGADRPSYTPVLRSATAPTQPDHTSSLRTIRMSSLVLRSKQFLGSVYV